MDLQFISQLAKPLCGEISIPGDKSISHRSVIFGAIAKGTTTINGFLTGQDCLATMQAFQAMGVHIENPSPQQLIIHGVGKYGLQAPKSAIDCGNSGTSMRLLTGLLAAQNFNSKLIGDSSLLKRPMQRISEPLSQMGASLETQDGKPPLIINGKTTLKGIHYAMPHASAQVKSCLLLAGLYAQGSTTVVEPSPTRDHTELLLQAFSYPLDKQSNQITITAQSECQATDITVPGDISSAAFFMVAAAITPGSSLIIKSVGVNPTRTGIITLLQMMGADITLLNQRLYGQEPVADIQINYTNLRGITIPESLVPLSIDELPVLCIAAAVATGTTILHGAKELRVKESDRIAAMVNGLCQLGIEAQAFDDGLSIVGGKIGGGEIDSHHDHRIAMAFSVAGCVAKDQILVHDCQNVNTSFPNFIYTAQQAGMVVQEQIHEKRI